MAKIPAIDVRSLSYTYEDSFAKALNNINLSISPSQFVVILGGSKSGKTTLLYALSGIVPNFFLGSLGGEISLNGRNIDGLPVNEISSSFGLIFQNFSNQLFSTNCLNEVAFLPENLGLSRERITTNIDYSIDKLDLREFLHRNPHTLSGGEKQKLAIASILSGRLPIIAFDEARTDLDPIAYSETGSLFESLKRDGITVLTAEEEIDRSIKPDSYILLSGGEIIKTGGISDISSSPNKLVDIGIKPPDFSFITPDNPLTDVDTVYEYLLMRDIKRERLTTERLTEKDKGVEIVIRGLTHTYEKDTEVLRNIDLSIYKSEWLTILGENGSGKTTLAKTIAGLLKPSSGEVYICDKNVSDISPSEMVKRVGYLFQDPDHQIFCESVFDEVAFGLKHQNYRTDEIERKVKETLSRLNLLEVMEEDPYSLTKGERQKVALASILVFEPDILILDEPTTGLDYGEIRRMMNLIKGLHESGTTIISITHSMWFAIETSDRIIVLKDGEVSLEGTPQYIFSKGDLLKGHHLVAPDIVKLSLKLGGFSPSLLNFFNSYTWRGRIDWT